MRRITGPDVLTRAEVAHVLGVHPSTVTRWAIRGLLPHFRTPNGERRYRRRQVQDLLNNPGAQPLVRARQLPRRAGSARPAAASRPPDRILAPLRKEIADTALHDRPGRRDG